MSDRALLDELLLFIDSMCHVNHYNNLKRKADEIRTRMAELKPHYVCKHGIERVECFCQLNKGIVCDQNSCIEYNPIERERSP